MSFDLIPHHAPPDCVASHACPNFQGSQSPSNEVTVGLADTYFMNDELNGAALSTCARVWPNRKHVFKSCCALQPLPKECSVDSQALSLDKVGIMSLELQKSYELSFGQYRIGEAVLDEEYWAAAWLRAESYSEEQPYLRYIESYRKKFAEQEFTALKRRCSGRQGQCIKCVCLVAITSDIAKSNLGELSQFTLRDRVVGTLDISLRQLLRGEVFPKEIITANQLTIIEPERRCGYIANVCVAKAARRQGIALSLLEVAIRVAKSWKLQNLYVHVNIGNSAARRLYLKAGFKVEGKIWKEQMI